MRPWPLPALFLVMGAGAVLVGLHFTRLSKPTPVDPPLALSVPGDVGQCLEPDPTRDPPFRWSSENCAAGYRATCGMNGEWWSEDGPTCHSDPAKRVAAVVAEAPNPGQGFTITATSGSWNYLYSAVTSGTPHCAANREAVTTLAGRLMCARPEELREPGQ